MANKMGNGWWKRISILIDTKHQTNFFNTFFHHPNLPFVVFSSDQQNDGGRNGKSSEAFDWKLMSQLGVLIWNITSFTSNGSKL